MVSIASSNILELKIQTNDLTLHTIDYCDRFDLANYQTDKICELMDNVPFINVNQAITFIKFHIARTEVGKIITMVARKDGEFVGLICLDKINTNIPEFGIWVASHQQNKGYGTQILQALYQWALDQNRFAYILYPSISTNVASRKLAEHIGARYLYHKQELIGSLFHTMIYYHLPTTHDYMKSKS